MEYYLAAKGNKVLIHATTWINLESMFRERNQSRKDTYYMIPFIPNIKDKPQRENRLVVPRNWGKG